MKIAIAQINSTVGDLSGNVARIADFSQRARAAGADLVVTPELALCGYPPEDLLLREDFLAACDQALTDLAARAKGVTVVVGHPRVMEDKRYNSASVVRDGAVIGVYLAREYNFTLILSYTYRRTIFPVLYAMIGAALGVGIASFFTRTRF